MAFKVKDADGNLYFVVGTNFHMADANPVVQFCMWSYKDSCWMVDSAANYILVEDE